MKELLVLRHAKSSWKEADLDDHDRPLNARGKRDAPGVGRLLRKQGLDPQVLVVSTARRTRDTVALMLEAFGASPALAFESRLYEGDVTDYVEIAAAQDDAARSVMLVGHNPTVEELVELLTGCDEPMPTAALARIELPVERWSELSPSTRGRLLDLWTPEKGTDSFSRRGK